MNSFEAVQRELDSLGIDPVRSLALIAIDQKKPEQARLDALAVLAHDYRLRDNLPPTLENLRKLLCDLDASVDLENVAKRVKRTGVSSSASEGKNTGDGRAAERDRAG